MNNWSYEKTIDLHGLTTSEAEIVLSNAIFEFNNSNQYDSLNIIVGRGTGTLKVFVRSFLERENLFFTEGEINFSVFKKEF
ncbi:Smr/MutS family protein [Mycoplasma sp. AC157]|uniref:Smr/MutS family protein n=1 Tax=Mycoplasma sp. 480 TaxID=3440155 RepID=UPI003F518232